MALEAALSYELHTGNELPSLTRRDADVAVRSIKRPHPHPMSKHIGPIRVALYAARRGRAAKFADVEAGKPDWIAPDDALPEHPSVVWRKLLPSQGGPALRRQQHSVSSMCTLMLPMRTPAPPRQMLGVAPSNCAIQRGLGQLASTRRT
ncbi:MAG: hypothetical protein ACN6OP_05845 [Pseudomonadales bacterium]